MSRLAEVGSSTERKHSFLDRYEEALKPFIKDRALDWEVELLETDVSHVRCQIQSIAHNIPCPSSWSFGARTGSFHLLSNRRTLICGRGKTNQFLMGLICQRRMKPEER